MALAKVIFTVSAEKIPVHTVKCTRAHRNFPNVTMNYSSAVFSCITKVTSSYKYCSQRLQINDDFKKFMLIFILKNNRGLQH